jgi:hypothetical protein
MHRGTMHEKLKKLGLSRKEQRLTLSCMDLDEDFDPSDMPWFPEEERELLKERLSHPEIFYKDKLMQVVKQYPKANLAEYCELFAEVTGIRISESIMHRKLKKIGLSHKEQRLALAES